MLNTLTEPHFNRNKMTIEVLEPLECLKSWLKLKDIVVDENWE
jgi:hypothetical protein